MKVSAAGLVDLHCDAMWDVVVNQSAGHRQSNRAKKFAVEVANRGGGAVSGIHLMCGYSFRTVWPVSPDVIAEVAHSDCLLVGGGSVAPGGTVSFNYTSYVRYDMTYSPLPAMAAAVAVPDGTSLCFIVFVGKMN